MKEGPVPDVLLDLDDTEYSKVNGYWYKIEAWRVDSSETVPQGMCYNLTLHDNHKQRILGFDNALAVKPRRSGRYAGCIVEYDHKHVTMSDKGSPYVFTDTRHLLEDFFNDMQMATYSREPLIKPKNYECGAGKCSASADYAGGYATLPTLPDLIRASLDIYKKAYMHWSLLFIGVNVTNCQFFVTPHQV